MTDFTTSEYISGGDPRQQLDVFAPDPEADLRTAVLVLHGGGFRFGERAAVHPRCRELAARGFTAIAVGYRLLDAAAWPAPLDDARAALRWTQAHAAELGVEPGRIVVQGHSAGAQLALLVAGGAGAGRPDAAGDAAPVPAPAAVIAYYAPAALSLTPGPGELPGQAVFGPEATADQVAAASPSSYIGGHFPPAVLIHGAGDRFIPPAVSLRFYEALTAAGVTGELHLIAGQDHEFDMTPRYTRITSDLVAGFVRAQIVEPEQAAKEALDANPFVSMLPPAAGPQPASGAGEA
jgi:acetyl esterase/lipase